MYFTGIFAPQKEASLIVTRWQAPLTPSKALIKQMFESEGLEPTEESFDPQVKISEHRHPFHEVRMVVSGELLFNIAGNQFLLRAGDRVEVPSNTKHSHTCQSEEPCLCIYAQRPI
jgi:quercetin dioxygenase-like cupin family protein